MAGSSGDRYGAGKIKICQKYPPPAKSDNNDSIAGALKHLAFAGNFLNSSAAIAALFGALALANPAFANGGQGGPNLGGADNPVGAGGVGPCGDDGTGGAGGGAGVTGGAGGQGGNAITAVCDGTGGAGGAGGTAATTVGTVRSGGNGANGVLYSGTGDGGGGGGGGGAHGFVGVNLTDPLLNGLTLVRGGNGGDGSHDPSGGGGGAGGWGMVLTGSGNLGVLSFSVQGGNGGSAEWSIGDQGGSGGRGLSLEGSATQIVIAGAVTGGNGGSGSGGSGKGGDGITASSSEITISAAVTGGNGGTIGFGGAGGAGITGSDLKLLITNGGSVTGGLSGNGNTRANAIAFTGGVNTLELQAGYSISGNVAGATGTGTSDTLILGGAGNASFSVDNIGAGKQFQNFDAFQKTGASTWTLTGANTSASFDVTAGQLALAGATIGGVTVMGGMLGGNGTVSNLFVNSGATLAPGNSIGTINVTGNVTFDAGSFYQVEVDAAGNADLTHATGTATINGGTVEVLAGSGNYKVSTQYTILTADGGLTGVGVFSKVTSNFAFLTPVLSYDANNVYLTMSRVDFANIGNTPNQRATGRALESLGAGALFDAALQLDAPGARAALDRLSGEIHASARAALIEDSRFVREAALDELTGGNDSRVWGRAFGSSGHLAGDRNAAKVERAIHGFFVGADGQLADNVRLGVLGGYSRSDFDANHASSASDSYHFGAYVGARRAAFSLRAGAAYSRHDLATRRSVAFDGFSDRLRKDYQADTRQVFAELGYGIDAGAVRVEPFINVAHARVASDGFTEKGGQAALKAKGQSASMTFSTLGAHLATDLGAVRFKGSLGWQRAFGDRTPETTLRFANGGNAFDITGAPLARNTAVVEAGLDFAIGKNATLGVFYNGRFASGMTDNGGRATLSVWF